MAPVKAQQIRNSSKQDLNKQLESLKQELASLRAQKVSNTNASKLVKVGYVRKDIARVNTVISHTRRDQLRVFYAGKKYIPTDLRAKKTRAIRRRLTAHELSRKTLKQQKKEMHFPQRKFAVLA